MTDGVRTRPKDRRDSIIAAASARFHRSGFAGTSLEDIAGDLQITAPAIYRHFRGKDDLYTVALEANLRRLEECIAAASDETTVIRGLAELGVTHPTLGLLWRPDRRRRLVDPDGTLERRLQQAVEALASVLEVNASPELSRLLARTSLAVVSSTGFYETALDSAEHAHEMALAIAAVMAFRPTRHPRPLDTPADTPRSRPWSTRRSALLDACAALVVERGGYQAVTLEDVATWAGTTTSTLHQLFGSKADLFAAVLRRAVTWATVAIEQAAAAASTPEDALDRAVASSIELGVQHPSWSGSLADELRSLPDEVQLEVGRTVEEYLAEWQTLCAAVSTASSPEQVQVRMRAVLAVIDDRTAEGRGLDVLAREDTALLARRILRTS